MKPEDPEQYIRDLERRVSQTPEAAPFPAPSPPSSPPSGSPFSGPGVGPDSGGSHDGGFGPPGSIRPQRRAWNRTLVWVVAHIVVVAVIVVGVLIFGNPFGTTTVHGNLIMENSGAKDSIVCNDGDLKLDGDNNTYTVTGHCRRLGIFGSGNHVTVDSADAISAFGDDNAVIYHSGSPEISKTGNSNTVSQG
jgi:Protein of unknown function (DUF3060)